MPGLGEHSSTDLVKGLIIGDPGSGKTGALASLVAAGYKLRVYDFDNLLGSLASFVRKDCPDKINNVSFQTFTDKFKSMDNPVMMIGGRIDVQSPIDGIPKAYVNGLKQLTYWKTPTEDFGDPGKWGKDAIAVVDSLTTFSMAAFRYVKAMNPAAKEPQTHYFAAQQLVMNMLYHIGSEQMATNVLVLAHIEYKENHINITKGFPRSIGSAISSQIASVFNCVLMTETVGSKRIIRTVPNGIVDLKNPVSHSLPSELPLETGLATFFKAVTNHQPGN